MSEPSDRSRCRAVVGLALLLAFPTAAQEPVLRESVHEESLHEAVRRQMGDESYVLIESQDHARLLLFPAGTDTQLSTSAPDTPDATQAALTMTRSANSRERARGLTLLAGTEDREALDTALVLLTDPVASVREEALQLLYEHPHADTHSAIAIATNDPSPRVRKTAAELIDEARNDPGD